MFVSASGFVCYGAAMKRRRRQNNAPCTFVGCKKGQYAKSLCCAHYFQLRRGVELRPTRDQVSPLRVNLRLKKEDARLVLKIGKVNKLTLSEVCTLIVEAALAQGVQIEV